MTPLPSDVIDLLRAANAALAAGRDALLQGRTDAVLSLSQEAERLAHQLAASFPAGLTPAQRRDPELGGLLTEMRRLGRGNTLIAGEMLRHFHTALASLRHQDPDAVYGRDGGGARFAAGRALGTA